MNPVNNASKKFGEVWFLLCGALFLVVGIMDFLAGPPPSTGPEILKWVEASKPYLSISIEFLFFAVVFMLPGTRSLNELLITTNTNKYSFGCAIIKLVIPILAILVIIQGRLVFPVFGIALNPSMAELVVSLWSGGQHAVYELMGGATILVSLNLRKLKFGKAFVGLGVIIGVFDIVGAYPWLIGPKLMLVCQSLFALWFIMVGAKLYKISLTKV